MRTVIGFFVPGGLLLLAAAVVLHWATASESLTAFIRVYAYAVFAAGVLLGWRFNRSRLVLALLVLALADRSLLYFAGAPGTGRLALPAVAFLLPLNLAALSLLSERGVFTSRGLLRLGLVLGQLPVLAVLEWLWPVGAAAALEHRFVAARLLDRLALPQPALLAFGAAFLLLTLRFFLNPKPLEKGFLWALGAAFLALSVAHGGLAGTVYLATAGLILVISLIETSYAMAYRDELTGLPARRALNEALLELGNHYAVAMVDIDHFKKFNDRYGHDAGDQLLRRVAAHLSEVTGGGKAFRYGGEEFALLFPGQSVDEALPHLEAVREAIAASSFTLRGHDRPRQKPQQPRTSGGARKQVAVTVSIGVAERDERKTSPPQVLRAADKALYRAKKGGRDQVRT